jgi:hypothetical protein
MTRAYGSGRPFITVRRPIIRERHAGVTRLGFSCWRLVPTYEGNPEFAVLRVGTTTNSMAAFRFAR